MDEKNTSDRNQACAGEEMHDFIRTSVYDKYSDLMKITTRLDHISHGKTTFGTNWSNRWTYRLFVINIRCNWIAVETLRTYSERGTSVGRKHACVDKKTRVIRNIMRACAPSLAKLQDIETVEDTALGVAI